MLPEPQDDDDRDDVLEQYEQAVENDELPDYLNEGRDE